MDMNEASAMTEASGLIGNQDGIENSSARTRSPEQLMQPSFAEHASEQLRQMAKDAPLPSLFLAFLLGMWVSRRL
jgi:hypothetical protein